MIFILVRLIKLILKKILPYNEKFQFLEKKNMKAPFLRNTTIHHI